MTEHDDGLPTAAEIAALTARLRALSALSGDDDPAERAAFLADKDALLARIPDAHQPSETDRTRHQDTADGNHDGVAADSREAETHRWQTDAADPDRVAVYPEPIGHGWDRDADQYGADAADELFDAENPHAEPPDEWYDDDCDDLDHHRWFSGGYDTAHDEHLAALGHTAVAGPASEYVDDGLAGTPMPAEMLDGIEERRTGPAERDDPAELHARLAELSERLAASFGQPPGGWRTLSAAAAAADLAARGTDPSTARAAVADYLRETSERFGVLTGDWGLDQGDIDAIAAAHRFPAAAAVIAKQDATASDRAGQLIRWHSDDQTVEAGLDDSGVDGDGFDDGAGWSR